jgi:hypothetical protein
MTHPGPSANLDPPRIVHRLTRPTSPGVRALSGPSNWSWSASHADGRLKETSCIIKDGFSRQTSAFSTDDLTRVLARPDTRSCHSSRESGP